MISSNIQLGKQGLTENFIETLKSNFKNKRDVKIKVLPAACRDKKELKEISEKIIESLGKNYTAKTIGYTIAIKKWRKNMREED